MVKIESGLVVDVSSIKTMRPVRDWQQVNSSVDFDAIAREMARYIKSWEFDGDPSNPDSYLDLPPNQWKQAIEAVNSSIANLFS